MKKYKECVDNNSKSGRSPMTFEWMNECDGRNPLSSNSSVNSNTKRLKKLITQYIYKFWWSEIIV